MGNQYFHDEFVARIECWMTEVLIEMRKTNRLITKEAIFYYCYKKARSVRLTSGQISCFYTRFLASFRTSHSFPINL